MRFAHWLIDSVRPGQCRFICPGATVASEFWHDPESPDGRNIDEVFDRIEEPRSWVALYNVESDPAYASFLGEVMDAVRDRVVREQPGIFNVSGFLFISAPPSVTPFHIDRENNFWLQVRGRKSLHVWDPSDRETVGARAVEEFITHRSLADVRLKEEALTRGLALDVGPGDGVYWPATSPHMMSTRPDWAVPGDGVSVSIGECFYTSRTRRDAQVHQCNRVLRRLGLSPTPPGDSAWRDALKAPVGRALASAQVRFRNYDPPPGPF